MSYGPSIDTESCMSCNLCIESCPMDVFAEASQPGDPPVVRYPDECWYDGGCVTVCPIQPSAIRLVHPLQMRLALRRVK